jgi:hypothetical protein
LWIEEEEKINRQAAKHAKGRKKGAQAFLGSFFSYNGARAFLPVSFFRGRAWRPAAPTWKKPKNFLAETPRGR